MNPPVADTTVKASSGADKVLPERLVGRLLTVFAAAARRRGCIHAPATTTPFRHARVVSSAVSIRSRGCR
jgi:hypothetical protein